MDKPVRIRTLVLFVIIITYIIILYLLYPVIFSSGIAFSIFPIFVAAYLFGSWGGLAAGMLAIPLNYSLCYIYGGLNNVSFVQAAFWMIHIVLIFSGFIFGKIHDLRITLQKEKVIKKQLEQEMERLFKKWNKAIKEVNFLSGLVPICSNCKSIRNDEGYWEKLESFFQKHTELEFTHSICPDCYRKLYPEFYKEPSESNNPRKD